MKAFSWIRIVALVLLGSTCLRSEASTSPTIFPSGFSAGSVALNGSASLNGTRLRLTDGASNEAGSSFSTAAVNVQAFTNDFTFQLSNPNADGFTFVLQNQGTNALGGPGGYLGYAGITKSLAIKFDLYNNTGEGNDSTGLFTGGSQPFSPSTDLTASGVNLHGGNVIRAHMVYDGTTLTVVLTDTVTNATATQSYTVNIPSIVGATTAYAGFTAGTGGLSATQDILTWTYTPTTVTPTPPTGFSAGSVALNGSASLNGTRLRLTDGASNEAGSSFSTAAVNVQAFTNDFTFQLSNPNADGFTFVLQNQGTNALGGPGGYLGYAGITKSLAIKFDLYNNTGEGNDSTGLFTGGSQPFSPSTDLTASGVNLHGGNVIRAHMVYDGTTLTVVLTDTVTNATATQSYTVNIPSIVGATTAYAGFTAGTGGLSATQDILTWTYTPTTVTPTPPTGFSAGSVALNGSASLNGTRLRLTDGASNEAGSSFSTAAVNVQAFTNDFTFQLSNPNADGFTFVLQNQGTNALGGPGGYLGYAGITKSLAIKFDLYNNTGEGNDSTGLFTGGSQPFSPSTDLTASGVNLHGGNVIRAHMVYDGTTLTVVLTDTVTNATATQSYTVNIPSIVGATTAYAGFTAGTGGLSATQDILTWTYTPQSIGIITPQLSLAAGTYPAPQVVTITDATAGAVLYYTLDGTLPTSNSPVYSSPLTISKTEILTAIAILNGVQSAPAVASYVVNSAVTSSQVIKHVVVIFDENVSFDHYFATYPVAANPSGETVFKASQGTPVPNGLSGALLTNNPNATNTTNGAGATNPFRLDPLQAVTSDQDHNYGAEQIAFDNGKMDLFPYSVGVPDSSSLANSTGALLISTTNGLTMGYYDGNTVTALWNYAQHYAMSDHAFATNFGPSTPGAINLVSGQTNGAVNDGGASGYMTQDGSGGFTLIGDSDPTGDICSSASVAHMTGNNIGAMLSAANVTWGFFAGGFDLTKVNPNGTTGCGRSSTGLAGTKPDYVPHHQPFQYYASTANLNHVRPSSTAAVGTSDSANHQYDLHDFTDALAVGVMPAVSFIKATAAQDGHAGYSNPIDEQTFLVNTINAVESSPFWQSTAIFVLYDDSDGWYDHLTTIVNGSASPADPIVCGNTVSTSQNALPGVIATTLHAQGRCGYGPRIPLLAISPWANQNYIDSTLVDQTSIDRFLEDTFLGGSRLGGGSFDSISGSLLNLFNFATSTPPGPSVLLLNPSTGAVVSNK